MVLCVVVFKQAWVIVLRRRRLCLYTHRGREMCVCLGYPEMTSNGGVVCHTCDGSEDNQPNQTLRPVYHAIYCPYK